jgi:DNA-binding LacI/PurR family transcriptional regulator
VVVVDRKTASSFYTAYVGGNNFEVGKTAGQYVGDLLNGKGQVIQITGLPTSSPAVDRQKGFMEAIRQFPGIRVVGTLPGDWEKAVAKRRLAGLLDQHPGVDLIFAHNDVMALGAYEIWQEKGAGRKVKIVGIDGLAGPSFRRRPDGKRRRITCYPALSYRRRGGHPHGHADPGQKALQQGKHIEYGCYRRLQCPHDKTADR